MKVDVTEQNAFIIEVNIALMSLTCLLQTSIDDDYMDKYEQATTALAGINSLTKILNTMY